MIDILLATYNGERWLPELLESLRNQSAQRYTILARDDGSTDGTLAILHKFERANPGKLNLVVDSHGNLGVKGNYNRLLEASTAPYVTFCDQDDVWLPDRIRLTWDAMLSLEEEHGSETPILVHTDLEVVDESLKTIDPSFWHYQNLNPRVGNQFNRVLVQNVVTGCASMLNRALVDIALPIPPEAAMHDWWLTLIAAAFGVVEWLPRAMVRYRQHGVNIIGAQGWNLRHVIRKALWLLNTTAFHVSLCMSTEQAAVFLNRYNEKLNSLQNKTVFEWSCILERSWFEKRFRVVKYRFYKVGAIRNFGMLLMI